MSTAPKPFTTATGDEVKKPSGPRRSRKSKVVIPEDYFAATYEAAQLQWKTALEAAGGEVVASYTPDDQDPEVVINIGRVGNPNAAEVVVHLCGTHGVEGFVGSSIQRAWLESKPTVSENRCYLLVHPVNPFGMKHLRRTNKDNVDLNRNCFSQGEERPRLEGKNRETYRHAQAVLAPETMSKWKPVFLLRAGLLIARKGMGALRQAVAGGQYEHPLELYYGGTELAAEPAWVGSQVSALTKQAERVTIIDVHSGLGSAADDLLILSEGSQTGSDHQDLKSLYGKQPQTLHDCSTEAYQTKGDLVGYLLSLLPEACSKLGFIQEFGTYPNVEIIYGLAKENALWVKDSEEPLASQATFDGAKRELRELFVPEATLWRDKVLQRGLEVLSA